MLKRYMTISLLSLFLGGMCSSFSYSDNNHPSYPNRYPSQNIRPGISDESSNSQQFDHSHATGREEIAYMDDLDRDIHRRANRMGDWGYRENWRYDSKAFFKGETQPEAYEEEHPYGPGGIGYDPDVDYLRMRNFYLEEVKRDRDRQNALRNENQRNRINRSNRNTRSYSNQQNDYRRSYGGNGYDYRYSMHPVNANQGQ